MGIGIQGEPGGEVAQHARHRFDVHTVLQGNGSEGVAEIMESDFGDTSSLQHSFQHVIYTIR